MSAPRTAEDADARTRRLQLEMCLPSAEDAETRAGNAWQAAQDNVR